MISAHILAREVARADRTARDTVAGALTTAHAQQERLNVNTLIDDDRALERAEAIDRDIGRGREAGPLAGVPIALKDLIDQAGRPTTCGSSFRSNVAQESAQVVERLEAAGAVITSRTVLHEFAYGFSSENHWTGPVRNPLDQSLSCGGSSGGSAAAVASGQVPIAIGTDTGGSVRVPAALCGIFGLKVTHGRVSTRGVFPLAPTVDTVGPLAASIDDLALAYRVIAGYDRLDPWSRSQPVTTPAGRPDLRGIRVGVPVPWVDDMPVDSSVADAFESAVTAIQELGATVSQVEEPVITNRPEIGALVGAEAARIHRTWVTEGREYGPEVAERLEGALAVSSDDYIGALEWRSLARQRMLSVLEGVDILLTPTTGSTRKEIGVDTIDIDGEAHPYRLVLSCFTSVVNQLGCPALAAPIGPGNPPSSLQLIGAPWSEHRLLEVAAVMDAAGVFTSPPVNVG